MRSLRTLVACALLCLPACTTTVAGTPNPAATAHGERPSAEPSTAALTFAVLTLYSDFNAAWEQGIEAAMNYQVEHDHPALDYSLPFGRYADEALDGFIYSMDVTFVSSDPEGDGLISQQAVVRLAFLNRLAYFFSICEYE